MPRSDQRQARATVSFAYMIIMLSYIDPANRPMALQHYFKWLLPLFALSAWLFLPRTLRNIVCLIGLVGLCCIRLLMVPAASGQAASALLFAAPRVDFDALYMARSTVVDARGPMLNLFDYHQIPISRDRMLAVALRREFIGHENWQPIAPADTHWPAVAPGAPSASELPYGSRLTPIARFTSRIGFGPPCWLPPYSCAAAK